jgi:hypothetical protein
VARYIVANPLRAGLVEGIGNYPHWDCIWMTGQNEGRRSNEFDPTGPGSCSL